MQSLMGHHSNSGEYQVAVDISFEQEWMRVQCEMQGAVHVNQHFNPEGFENWNLWNFDVVELFLRRGGEKYLELQTSPLLQKFALMIEKPREVFHPYAPEKIKVNGLQKNEGFMIEINLHRDEIPGQGKEVFGNVHACLGPPKKRCYFGTNINSESKPDFHRPDLFIKLGEFL